MTEKSIETRVRDPKNILTWGLKLPAEETIFPITGAADETDPKAKVFLMNEKNDWYKVVLYSNGHPDVFAFGHNPGEETIPMTQGQFESFLQKFRDNVKLRKGEKAPDYDEIAHRFDKQRRTNIASWGRGVTAGMTLLEVTRS